MKENMGVRERRKGRDGRRRQKRQRGSEWGMMVCFDLYTALKLGMNAFQHLQTYIPIHSKHATACR